MNVCRNDFGLVLCPFKYFSNSVRAWFWLTNEIISEASIMCYLAWWRNYLSKRDNCKKNPVVIVGQCNKLCKRQHLFLGIYFVSDRQEPNSTQPNEPRLKNTQGLEWRGNTRSLVQITIHEHNLHYLHHLHHL